MRRKFCALSNLRSMLRWTRHIGIIFLLLFGGMGFLCPSAYAEIKIGNCGTNVKYELNTDTKVMRIYGTGAMKDYTLIDAFLGILGLSSTHDVVSVIIEEGVTRIGNYAFSSCGKLTSISIANSVTEIGKGAFYNCEKLPSIRIPGSVTEIGYSAFFGTEKLKEVYPGWTVAPIPTLDGKDVSESMTIYVPCGTTDLYESTVGWGVDSNGKEINTIKEAKHTITVTTDDDSMGTVEIIIE